MVKIYQNTEIDNIQWSKRADDEIEMLDEIPNLAKIYGPIHVDMLLRNVEFRIDGEMQQEVLYPKHVHLFVEGVDQ